MRIQHYLALCGVASRRKSEEYVLKGRVSVNGMVILRPGHPVDPDQDVVSVDGRPVTTEIKKVYIMLHKPVGYISTAREQFGRPGVLDLVPEPGVRLYPVGRLDYDSSGLLLLTNDGSFTKRVTHPSSMIRKVYLVETDRIPDARILTLLGEGIAMDGGMTAPADVAVLPRRGRLARVGIAIHEGKNRQVRRMFETVGLEVISLKRIAIGGLTLGTLPKGKIRYMTGDEADRAFLSCDFPPLWYDKIP